MVIAMDLCSGDELESLREQRAAELLCWGALSQGEGKVKPGLGNTCFTQTKDLFTEKIPTYPEFQ